MSKVITTVFSTHCWRRRAGIPSQQARGRFQGGWAALEGGGRALFACLLIALWVSGPARAQAEPPGTNINQFSLERTDEGVFLSATMRLVLPAVVEDALEKGIPMFFVAEAVMYRDRWYWTDRQVASAARYMRLSHQPLTRRWRLTVSPSPIGNAVVALGQNFDTSEEALATIRRISQWKIADAQDLDSDGRFSVNFRFRLDVSQLPRPFQIGAVGQSDWNIATGRSQRLPAEGVR